MTRLANCSHDPDKVIYNFLDCKLTESETFVLHKDLEFEISPKKLEYSDFVLLLQFLFRDIKSTNLSILQIRAVKSNILVICLKKN